MFAKERSAVLSFELETVDFTFARYRSKITELDFRFPSPVCYGPHPTSHVVVSFIPCLFFYSRHFVPRTESLAFPESSPFGRRPFERISTDAYHDRMFTVRSRTCSDLNQQQIDSRYNCTMSLTGNTVK